MSSVSSEVKKLKVSGLKMLRAGLDSSYIATNLKISKTLVKEWEEEYVKEVLADGQGQRVRTRAMLMRMTPQVLMGLNKLATQEIEPRMQLAASQAIMRFGMAFMREDAMLSALESSAKEGPGSLLMRDTLFDLPDGIGDEAGDAVITRRPAESLDKEKVTAELSDDPELLHELDDAQEVVDSSPDETDLAVRPESSGSSEDSDDDIGESDDVQEADVGFLF